MKKLSNARKIFIDTANIKEIESALQTGIVSGVTTNPSLMAKEPKADFLAHMKKIADICQQNGNLPLSVEVFAKDPDGMYIQAREIYEELKYGGLNIKIPIGFEELKIINRLVQDEIPVNCTCCFTATQLQAAAAAGSRYVSLFYNRLLDVNGDPTSVLNQVNSFITANELQCEIIAGSIRAPEDVSTAWHAGSHIVTAGYKILSDMTKHAQTDRSVSGFLSDFEAWLS